jgi:hypothetical protein
MKLQTLLVAGSLALATTTAFAQTTTGPATGPGTAPSAATQDGMSNRNSSMQNGAGDPNTHTFQGGRNNSTGNMNEKGTGPGTTGTGGVGGSGNR